MKLERSKPIDSDELRVATLERTPLGPWHLLRELGGGGQGKVHLATRVGLRQAHQQFQSGATQLARKVAHDGDTKDFAFSMVCAAADFSRFESPENLGALKILGDWGRGEWADKARARLERELAVLKEVQHPNLIRLLDEDRGRAWFVMEFVPCGSLASHMTDTPGDVRAALTFVRPLVEALGALHAKGVIHRDVKPANILLREDGAPVLADLGIVFRHGDDQTRLTSTLESVGTDEWMPEYAQSQQLDVDKLKPCFDLFAIGKLIWCLIAGRKHLKGDGWDKPNRNLEKMFADKPEMAQVNSLLAKTVVDDDDNCHATAKDVLDHIDDILLEIDGGTAAADGLSARCQVCRRTEWELVASEDDNALHRWGLTRNTWDPRQRIYECGHCGATLIISRRRPKVHDEPGELRPAWRKP